MSKTNLISLVSGIKTIRPRLTRILISQLEEKDLAYGKTASGIELINYKKPKDPMQPVNTWQYGTEAYKAVIQAVGETCPDWVKPGMIIITWAPAPHTKIRIGLTECHIIDYQDILGSIVTVDEDGNELLVFEEEADAAVNSIDNPAVTTTEGEITDSTTQSDV